MKLPILYATRRYCLSALFVVFTALAYGQYETPYELTYSLQGSSVLFCEDIDGDGDDDILAETAYRGIVWFEQTGSLTFSEMQVLPIDNSFVNRWFTVGDVDLDGDVDLIVYQSLGDRVVVYYNLGNLSFSDPLIIWNGTSGVLTDMADFNNDGYPDILITSGSGSHVMLSNLGTSFTDSFVVVPTNQIRRCYIADADDDGDQDILELDSPQYKLQFFRNDGSGSFVNQGYMFTGSSIMGQLMLQDMNDDGISDMVYSETISGSESTFFEQLKVRHGTGNGNFSSGANTCYSETEAMTIRSHCLVDWNSDGVKDVITNYGAFGNSVFNIMIDFMRQEHNSASFSDAGTPKFYREIQADDDPELELAYIGYASELGVMDMDGDGPTAIQILGETINSAQSVVPFDMDLDGDEDILVVGSTINLVGIYENLGDGFGPMHALEDNFNPLLSAFKGPLIHDLNLDGLPDIIFYDYQSSQILIYLTNGDWYNSPMAFYLPSIPRSLQVLKLDDDLYPDLVYYSAFTGILHWMKGTPSGTFFTDDAVISSTEVIGSMEVEDVDQDGDDDLIALATEQTTWTYGTAFVYQITNDLNVSGEMVIETISTIELDPYTYGNHLFQDIDGNGNKDILWSIDDSLYLLLDSAQTFGQAVAYPSFPIQFNFYSFDYNHDGDVEFYKSTNYSYASAINTIYDWDPINGFYAVASFSTSFGSTNKIADLNNDLEYEVITVPTYWDVYIESLKLQQSFNAVSASVFEDHNSDGEFDPVDGDFILGSIPLRSSGPQGESIHYSNGIIELDQAVGVYSLSPLFDPQLWTQTTNNPLEYIEVTDAGVTQSSSILFGLHPLNEEMILDVQLYNLPWSCVTNETGMAVHVKNVGNISFQGELSLTPDSGTQNILYTQPQALYASPSQVIWQTDLINPGEEVVYFVDTELFTDQPLVGEAFSASAHLNDATYSESSTSTGIYACNANGPKMYGADGEGMEGWIHAGDTVRYFIRFANTSGDSLNDAHILDVLPPHFDLESFVFHGSTHPAAVSLSNNGHLDIFFHSLQLPPYTEFADSGFVFLSFSLRTLEDIAPGTLILNCAHVFFENGNIGSTNICRHTVIDCMPVSMPPLISLLDSTLVCTLQQYTYQWYFNGEPLEGETNMTMTPLVGGNYHVEIYAENGCQYESQTIQIAEQPVEEDVEWQDVNVNLFPNPTTQFTLLSFDPRKENEMKSVKISDVWGKTIFNGIVTGNSFIIDTSHWSDGLYLLRVTDSESTRKLKLVVTHE